MALIPTPSSQMDCTLCHNPGEWLSRVLELRADHEVLLMDGFQDTLTMILSHPPTATLRRVDLVLEHGRLTRIPRPSDNGMGETIWAQDVVRESLSLLEWDPQEHAPRSVRGKGVFTYPLGPVRADVAESVLYRLAVMGDEILRLDLDHQLKRRHVASLACGRHLEEAAAIVERTTGTSTVAHALAYSLAVEDALDIAVPPAVQTARMILGELERVYSHLGDLAALAVSTGLPVPQMEYLHHRETILRINFGLFGHRMLRGVVRPGGVDPACWPEDADPTQVIAPLAVVLDETARMQEDLLHTPSFLDRLNGAGLIPADTIAFVRPVGPVGRAAGRDLDVRQWRPYSGYAQVLFEVSGHQSADAFGRFAVKTEELQQSLAIVRRLLGAFDREACRRAPRGAIANADSVANGTLVQGLGVVEAPRGQLAYRVLLDAVSRVVRHVGVATPSARNWYTVPPAMANHNILQDFPIIDASFILSVAGWDG